MSSVINNEATSADEVNEVDGNKDDVEIDNGDHKDNIGICSEDVNGDKSEDHDSVSDEDGNDNDYDDGNKEDDGNLDGGIEQDDSLFEIVEKNVELQIEMSDLLREEAKKESRIIGNQTIYNAQDGASTRSQGPPSRSCKPQVYNHFCHWRPPLSFQSIRLSVFKKSFLIDLGHFFYLMHC